jgi:hypothetical protein
MKKLCKAHQEKVCDLHKARVDEGLSPNSKAAARVARGNVRYHYDSPKDTHNRPADEASWERGHVPHAGKPGEKVTGLVPSRHGASIHTHGDYEKGTPKSSAHESHKIAMEDIKSTKFNKSEEEEHFPDAKNDSSEPCPYCADNEDNRTDDCTYCQTLDAEENADGTAGMHDCQACNDYDQKNEPKEGIDDCPYCQTENITVEQAYPEKEPQHVCNCPNCEQNKDQTGLAVEDMGAEHPNNCPECQKMYGNAIENEPGQTAQEDPNLQGHETAEEVLDLLDQEPGKGAETPKEEASKIDNTELPQGNATDGNVSVKENFGQAQRDDDSQPELGSDSQDEPNVTGILKDGLDEHAQDMQKQKVLDMVSQTLQGFKANKASLEATKEQNQALYSSCIQMLKSMIELCKLLGLEPKMASSEPKEVSEEPEAQPQNAAPSEGAAEAPKAQSGV